MIACVVVPEFAAAVYDATEGPRDAPLVLVRYERRGKVVAVSSEAKTFGIQPGLSLSRARALCPAARFVNLDSDRIERALDRLLETLWTFTNRIEVEDHSYPQAAICYLDLGNLNEEGSRFLGTEILRLLRDQCGLSASVGLAGGKFAAYIAAMDAKPDPVVLVPQGQEAAFIAPKPVVFLPMSKELARRLHLFHVRTLGQFAAFPRSGILSQFGRSGYLMYQLAHGIDSRPVQPRRMPAAETVSRAFDDGLVNRFHVTAAIQEMAAELSQRLDRRVSALHEITLSVSFESGQRREEQLHLLQPVAGTAAIAETLGQLVDRAPLHQPVTALDVCVTHLVPNVPRQLELFTHKPARQALIDLTSTLVKRYGSTCFYEARLEDASSLLPERRFALLKLGAS